MIDEAHALPLRLLEEVRMITNLVRDGQPRVRLVMAGGSKLEEKFASPKLASFNQRIAARCYLEAFGRDDTVDYVLARISAAGGNADAIFDEGALRAIYQATDGIPRLINQVCDHALVMAFAGGRSQIDAAGVEEAWADLQQLPGPWQDTGAPGNSETTIEFGELDDEPAAVDEVDGESVETLAVCAESVFGFVPTEVSENERDAAVQTQSIVADHEPSVSDPFGDGFDEEEVVIHQAVIQSASIFANRTRVISREGRELAASVLPEPKKCESTRLSETVFEEEDATPDDNVSEILEVQASVVAERSDVALEGEEETPASTLEPVAATNEESSQADWVTQASYGAQMFEYTAFEPNSAEDLALQALCDVNIALGDLESEFETSVEPTVKLMDHLSGTSEDDRSIIVVENDEPTPVSSTPEGSVHRVEYQTLFSQLRHG